MDAQRLSMLSWTLDDRRAWSEAYAHARAIDRRRKRLEREAGDRIAYVSGRGPRIVEGRRFIVHADLMGDES